MSSTSMTPTLDHDHDHDYAQLLSAVRQTFAEATAGGTRLFSTDTEGLYPSYLDNVGGERQVHTCRACQRFIESFGGAVTIAEDGTTTAAFWDVSRVPSFYARAIDAMRTVVHRRPVTGVFLCADPTWGTPRTGDWSHLAVEPPAALVHRHPLLTAGQAMAAKREDFKTVERALADFTPHMLGEALRLLQAEALARSERFLGPVQWLLDLHQRRGATRNRQGKDNILWRAIAEAPEGYCHPRASVVGSLLEDIAAGMSFEQVQKRFNAKMHPLKYQRPQAAPSVGNLAAAERIVEQMGLRSALDRRFARLDECQTLWTPAAPKAGPAHRPGGVFGHITPKEAQAAAERVSLALPEVTMTWAKFRRTVLAIAERMEFMTPRHGNFMALLTAADPEAPPILKWDHPDRRNPVSHYVYHGGSDAGRWKLSPGWTPVTGVVPFPQLWGDRPMTELGDGVLLVLRGAADTMEAGLALFPETMRAELHAIRATIEAYSQRGKLLGREEASACGYCIRSGRVDARIRVLTAGRWTHYRIDRWE